MRSLMLGLFCLAFIACGQKGPLRPPEKPENSAIESIAPEARLPDSKSS